MKIKHLFYILMLLVLFTVVVAARATPPSVLTASSLPGTTDPITISTGASTAGSLCSVLVRGVEHINCGQGGYIDHGREWQAALTLPDPVTGINLEEADNPTEAGAGYPYDGFIPSSSTSVLLAADNPAPNVLHTRTQMAYWHPYGGQRLSTWIIDRTVTIGLPGMPHALDVFTQIIVPAGEPAQLVKIEMLTGYMPPAFRNWHALVYDAPHDWLRIDYLFGCTSSCPGYLPEQQYPIMVDDLSGHALAVYSSGLPQASYPTIGYGRWTFPAPQSVSKWNMVYRVNTPATYGAPTTLLFDAQVVLGTPAEVEADMKTLIKADRN